MRENISKSSLSTGERKWRDGWMTCDFASFSTVSYQDDGRMIMKDYLQWNPVYN